MVTNFGGLTYILQVSHKTFYLLNDDRVCYLIVTTNCIIFHVLLTFLSYAIKSIYLSYVSLLRYHTSPYNLGPWTLSRSLHPPPVEYKVTLYDTFNIS